uniref:C2H2-type domain-containing protein n=1 Tax=Trichogramma kaykai TaxID=54128 RepID=A0ABD2W455_9HYME
MKHQKIVHEGRKDFACNKCEKTFGQKPHFFRHQETIHKNRQDSAEILVDFLFIPAALCRNPCGCTEILMYIRLSTRCFCGEILVDFEWKKIFR